jgi:hypothetical protein
VLLWASVDKYKGMVKRTIRGVERYHVLVAY